MLTRYWVSQMSDFLPAKYILVDFLRKNLTDPRDRAEDTDSDTFTATASQTDFTCTPLSGSISCITSVTVEGTSQTKWQDYWIDFRNQKVIFFTGITVGDEVIINYKYGTTNWIYWDKPRTDLSETSFPRLNIMTIGGTGTRLGNSDAPVESTVRYQIDIWVKETKANQIFTISGRKYSGEELAEYIASKVTETFEDSESDLYPVLYGYYVTQVPRDLPFNETYQCYHKVVEVELKGLDLNRIN